MEDSKYDPSLLISVPEIVYNLPANWTQWIGAIGGAVLVGLTGVLPLWVVPAKVGTDDSGAGESDNLKYLLAFAVGGLLGDVFLHLLPETYQHVRLFYLYLIKCFPSFR